MTDIKSDKNRFLTQFEHFEREYAELDRPAVRRLRKTAIARFDALGFPTSRNEDWKFTSLAGLLKIPFRLAPACEAGNIVPAALDRFTFGEHSRLVFVNGRFAPELSLTSPVAPGVIFGSLASALKLEPDAVEPHLGRIAEFKDNALTALNTAFLHDGAFLSVPAGQVIEQPIHVVHVASGCTEPLVSHPRHLLVVGRNSQVRIVESYAGLDDGPCFTNGVTEVIVAEGAMVDHYRLQRESKTGFQIGNLAVHLGQSSNFSTHLISLGGSLVRNETRVLFEGEHAEATVNGLYMASGAQHIDNLTVIDHAQPNCASHELYKGILDGKAHGVFNGKIFVRQDAQKTDAKQTNQTLLLSEDATLNTKPQLEIFADDVKCTHGATVGNLNEEAVFYLRTRGLGLAEARSLLTYAFANDIIGRIQIDLLRQQLEDEIRDPNVEIRNQSEAQNTKQT